MENASARRWPWGNSPPFFNNNCVEFSHCENSVTDMQFAGGELHISPSNSKFEKSVIKSKE